MPLFIPITKVDIAQRLVYGTISEEIADKTGEILDYESSKPAFLEWSQQFHEASGGKSFGNVRAMHGNVAAGKLTDIAFDDENRRIEGVAKVVDDDAWNKVLEGVYTGFSIGGGYVRRWPDPHQPGLMRYTPTLSEVSLVDNPAVPTATFSVVKIDGTTELRRFMHKAEEESDSGEQALRSGLVWLSDRQPDEKVQQHIDALLAYLDGETEDTEKNMGNGRHKMIEQLSKLTERVKHLEAMPQLPRGALKSVSKSDDYESAGIDLSLTGGSDRAHELIKIALSNPRFA